MTGELYRYAFTDSVNMDDVEELLILAYFGAESLHGESQARLDAAHAFDRDQRSCVVDASTAVGRDINRLFTGYLRRELASNQFSVRRLERCEPEPAGMAA